MIKDKLSFKYPPIGKKTVSMDQKPKINTDNDSIPMELVMRHFEDVCQRLESSIRSQNQKIESLESKYSEAMLSRFDKLISVNQNIGKNLERIVQKLQGNEVKISPAQFPPLINSPITNIEFSVGKFAKSQISPSKELLPSSGKSLIEQKKRKSSVQIETLMSLPDQKMSKEEIISKIKENHLFSPSGSNKFVYSPKCPNALNQIFRNIVQFNFSEEVIGKMMNKLMGQFYHKTAESYYKEYSSNRISYNDFRIGFSYDIINEALHISSKWLEFLTNQTNTITHDGFQITGKDFFRLFNDASLHSLEYLIHKYPPSRAKQIDTELIQKIKQIRHYSIVKYDLLRNAQMEFGIVKDQKDFSVEIKNWINALITETKKELPEFKKTMKTIFNNNEGSLDGTKVQNQVQYLIGSKIPENTPLYSKEQIDSSGLPIKNPQILRILIKWYEDLRSNFVNTKEKIIQNRFGFKNSKQNAIAIRIPHSRLQILADKLKGIYQTQLKHLYKQQNIHIGGVMQGLIAISNEGIDGYQFLDEREATIIKLAQCLNETFKSYILLFLNHTLQKLVKIRSLYEESASQSSINLVSFNILDLLRCKCTGTKREIYRIYNQILEKKDYFQIIRVKNKLNEPTRDILINLKLKKSFLICEVQLSLGSVQEEVNDHFCHYLYELERSGFGVLFQCASQIANLDPRISYMRKHKDLRFKKKTKMNERAMERIKVQKNGIYCNTMHEQTPMQMMSCTSPYCCMACNSFIPANKNLLPHLRCPVCQICICNQCVGSFSHRDSYVMLQIFKYSAFKDKNYTPKQFFKQQFIYSEVYDKQKIENELLKYLKTEPYVVICIADKSSFQQIVYKKFKSSIIQTFTTIPEIPHLTISPNSRPLCAIAFFKEPVRKKLEQIEGYMKYHIDMGWWRLQEIFISNKVTEVICVVEENLKSVLIIDVVETDEGIQRINLEKDIKGRICYLNKSNDNYLQITSKGLKSIQFFDQIQKKSDMVILNLWQNKISDIGILSQFPNIEQLYLQDNQILSMNPILSLKKLQLLVMGENQLSGSFPRMDIPNLQFIMMGQNNIDDISNMAYSKIPNITCIKLYHNKIKQIPRLNFEKLEVLLLNNNNITNLRNFSTSTLPRLYGFDVSFNCLTGTLEHFNFPQLKYLKLNNNKISSLNDFQKSTLPNLKCLDLSFNQISGSLVLPTLPSLRNLVLQNNQLTSVEDIFLNSNFSEIENINLKNNKIAGTLPIMWFPKLSSLNLEGNHIYDIRKLQQSSLACITNINLSNNRIEGDLPVIQFRNLKKIDLSFNLIDSIKGIKSWRSAELSEILLNNNKIRGKICSLELYSLEIINLAFNEIDGQEYIQNVHLTPLISSIILCNNSQKLKRDVQEKYRSNESLMKKIQL